jgi:hypothetical protein
MTKNTNQWKKYEKKYGCTRNQYRRIINGAPYSPALDGSLKDHEARKKAILGEE